jgi:UDP-N-acetylmuramoylalanine--D-glutamate ligase
MGYTSLFGYGGTTKALALHVKNPLFFDDKVSKPFTDENGFKVKPSSEFDPQYSVLEITSPGIPPYNELILKAQNLISEYDFFADVMPFSVWISGTNGKTTTTQMTQYLLKEHGSVEGGNIGVALGKLDQSAPIWVLETSSFTLHYTNKARPNLYVLLPLSPDHLSWHGDMQGYIDDKLKPIKMMKDGEIAILPKAYEKELTLQGESTCNAHTIFYEDEHDLAETFDIDLEKIKFKGVFLLDAVLALCVKKVLFNQIDYNKINAFVIDPHRQEELHDAKGRLWVNDTKATNLDATIGALKRYKDQTIHLILGGDDKGVDLTELFEFMKPLHVSIYAIGSNEQKLVELSSKFSLTCKACAVLENAVKEIDSKLQMDEVALLSPASASLDQFTSYAQRGDLFKQFVKSL